MKVEMTKKETNVVELKVEVPQDQVEQAIAKAYVKTRKDYSLPGFRKGKVPRNILEKRYGIEIFYEEAANILIQDTYPQVVEEQKLEPVDHPDITVDQFDSEQPFIYTATVTVCPELKLGKYKGLKIAKEEKQVTDEDVEAEIKALQNSKARLIALEADAVAANDDQVIIDFVGKMDGEEFEGGTGANYPLALGSGSFVPGFEEQLIGAKQGEKVLVKLTMPQEYHSEELAGKEVEFEVEIKEIKRKELPALDDDFAKEVGDYETLTALKDFIRERLEDRARQEAADKLRHDVLEAVREKAEVDIPGIMIENETKAMLRQMENRFAQQGLKFEDYLSYSGKSLDDIMAEMRPGAEKNVKTELLLDTVSKVENISVEEAELEEEIAQLAKVYGQEAKAVRSALEKSDQLAAVEQIILHRKALDFLAEVNIKS
ncbi:MAG: trigger factor [Eubacteriales bacterium]|nr:trigger factor [Eubacteriales bacterium]MDD4078699.1 trigger factor [Eubacteriales bacterium]MDD4768321.1 trigger factor [Eubacteriales bacterium]